MRGKANKGQTNIKPETKMKGERTEIQLKIHHLNLLSSFGTQKLITLVLSSVFADVQHGKVNGDTWPEEG